MFSKLVLFDSCVCETDILIFPVRPPQVILDKEAVIVALSPGLVIRDIWDCLLSQSYN